MASDTEHCGQKQIRCADDFCRGRNMSPLTEPIRMIEPSCRVARNVAALSGKLAGYRKNPGLRYSAAPW